MKFKPMAKLIFILEDDQDIRDLYSYILEDQDYELETFPTIEAFNKEKAQIPDLYLLDVNLPDGDGLELCAALKNNPKTAAVPVIIISAHTDKAEVKSICPDAEYISKPFDIQHLASKISNTISTHI